MPNFELTLPTINVDVEVASGSFVVIRQPTTTLNRSAIPIQNVAEMAITSSYALTASNALVAVTALNATITPGTVSSSQQIINYNRFATTGSNTFLSDQTITSTSGSIVISVTGNITGSHQFADNAIAPFIEIESADEMESTLFETYQLFQHTDTQGYFGFTIDASRAGFAGWGGPAIAGDDGLDNYPVFIGFQDKTSYTDGRVTILTPLEAQMGVTGSLSGSVTAYKIVIPKSSPTQEQTGSMYFNEDYIYVYTGTQWKSASLN